MTDNPNKLSKFWQELKRRKVIRVIIVYATTAFILLQLVDLLLEPLHLPHWVMTFFVVLLLVGFPIVVILAWIFDITPQGVEVTKSGETTTDKDSYGIFSKKYMVFDIIIGVLLVAVIILGYPKIFNGHMDDKLEKTIALIPPTYDGNDSSKIYYINTLWNAVIDNLSQIKEFKRVLPNQSVLQFRNSTMAAKEIANMLDVNYIGT